MKIAYIGNFTQKHCTEVHIAATLEDLGHEVIRLQENEVPPETLTGMIANATDWGLLLFTRTWGNLLTLEHLAQLRERKIPSASYHLDLYIGLERKYLHEGKTLEVVLQTDPFWRTDFVFTPDGDPTSAEVFKANGVKHYYMKAGVYKPECYIADPSPDFRTDRETDVLFVGGGDKIGSPHAYGHPEWNYRNELITFLYLTYGKRFAKYGHPQETIRNELLNNQYAVSKVTVGDSVCIGFNHENYWSDRVYETLGRGGFLIHPYIKGFEEEFVNGKHLAFYDYGNFEQLRQKIDYYLENDEERETIRLAGHEFVKNNCTYHDRLRQMLTTVFDNPAHYVPKPEEAIKINLGAGSEPTEGWLNVDWIKQAGIDVVHNLLEFPWTFADDEVADEIKAIDVLEHMPLFTEDLDSTPIMFIEECHRILRTGGKLFITVPHWQSPNLWIDPTHVRGYDEKSMDYFDPETDHGKWYGYYSDKKFKVSSVRTPNNNVEFTMVKR